MTKKKSLSNQHFLSITFCLEIICRGSVLARRTANFADPTCQFWLVFTRSPFQIFKKVRIILRPKFTNLNFCLPTIYINQLTRKKPETLHTLSKLLFSHCFYIVIGTFCQPAYKINRKTQTF